jgi:molybdopterin converting factor small subunit
MSSYRVSIIVKLTFLGHLKDIIGVKFLDIQISSKVKLGEFLRLALGMYPSLNRLLNNEGHITREEVLVLINGIDINVFEDPYSELYIENSDEITFIPITHGGLTLLLG